MWGKQWSPQNWLFVAAEKVHAEEALRIGLPEIARFHPQLRDNLLIHRTLIAMPNDEYDFAAFSDALARRDYEAAVNLVMPFAAAGNSDAQCSLALLYEHGWGVPRDVAEAERWLTKATEADNPVAWSNLATLYITTGRSDMAERCYRRAKELGLDVANPYPPNAR